MVERVLTVSSRWHDNATSVRNGDDKHSIRHTTISAVLTRQSMLAVLSQRLFTEMPIRTINRQATLTRPVPSKSAASHDHSDVNCNSKCFFCALIVALRQRRCKYNSTRVEDGVFSLAMRVSSHPESKTGLHTARHPRQTEKRLRWQHRVFTVIPRFRCAAMIPHVGTNNSIHFTDCHVKNGQGQSAESPLSSCCYRPRRYSQQCAIESASLEQHHSCSNDRLLSYAVESTGLEILKGTFPSPGKVRPTASE